MNAPDHAPLSWLPALVAGSELLPGAYAEYRPLLADGLAFFLKNLPPHRLVPIWREQMALGEDAPLVERLVALIHHLPTLHKLGQVVSRDQRLQPALRSRLQRLESLVPTTPQTVVAEMLQHEIPDWGRRGVNWVGHPLAEGSVAVVVPFSWRDQDSGQNRRGVFKMLLPGIEQKLEEDLEIWSQFGTYLEQACVRYQLPPLDYRATFDTVRDLLEQEIHLDREQANLRDARRLLRSCEGVVVPELMPLCTPRLTAMTQIRGLTLTRALEEKQLPLSGLAPCMAEALVVAPIFSREAEAVFHADPHPGNLMLTSDGKVALLDWSLAARLAKSDRESFAQLLIGTVTFDAARMGRALEALTVSLGGAAGLDEVLAKHLRHVRWGTFPGIAWLTGLMDDAVARCGAKFRPEWILFRKSLFCLHGLLDEVLGEGVGAGGQMLDRILLFHLLGEFMAEWPERWRGSLASRAWPSHLSTEDILWSLWSTPAAWARYWRGWWSDWTKGSISAEA